MKTSATPRVPSQAFDSAPISRSVFTTRRRSALARSPRLLLALAATLSGLTVSAQEEADEDVMFTLSPFTVEASSNMGYQATSSLAGTRINSDLRDLGAAISVVTPEFIEDTAVTGIEDLLVYTTGTEVGGSSGNFTNSGNTAGRASQQDNRENPEGNTRVRGLVRAEISRDYFITDFGFDTYNVERVDISRGPNSILFGVGSPGGVINYSSKTANLLRDRYRVAFRVDQRGSHRETLDFNQILIPKRFAVRINALNERKNFEQEPAYSDDQRLAAALTGVLYQGTKNKMVGTTTFRSNLEFAEVQTTPPNVIAPIDTIRDWYMPPNVEAIENQTGMQAPARYTDGTFVPQAMHDQFGAGGPFLGSEAQRLPWFITVGQIYTNSSGGAGPSVGFTNPQYADLQAVEGRVQGSFDWLMQSSLVDEPWTTGFTAPTFQNTHIYDFVDTLLSGRMEERQDSFQNQTFTLEQLFWKNRFGVELAYNKQELDRRNQFTFGGGESFGIVDGRAFDVKVDNNLWLGNGQPNPNAGRPLLVSRVWGNHAEIEMYRETKRATAFLELDFKELIDDGWASNWLGRHVFSGLVEEASRYERREGYAMAVSSDEIDMEDALSGLKNNFRRQLHAAFYVGPDLRQFPTYEDVQFGGYIDVPLPKHGDEFVTFVRDPNTGTVRQVTAYADEFLKQGSANERIIDTKAITWQGYLVKDLIVGMYGIRQDRVRDTLSLPNRRLDDGALDPISLQLQDEPNLDIEGETTSWSVVAHYPDLWLPDLPLRSELSLFYSKSENFTPVGFRQDVYLNPLSPPSGQTEEKGFLISMLDRRFSLRVNWYETENTAIALDTNLDNQAVSPVVGWVSRLLEAQRLGVPFGYDYTGRETGLAEHHSSYDEVIDTLINMVPEPLKTESNIRIVENAVGDRAVEAEPVQGLVSSSDLIAKGVEIELTANVTDNWRLALNIAKQETIRSGSGSELGEYYGQIRQSLVDARLWDEEVFDEPNVASNVTYKQRFTRDVLNPLAAITARDGAVSQEQRKWRVNFTTGYTFDKDSLFKGVGIGGSIRWQDKAAVGYPINLVESEGDILQVPDLDNPFYASSQWNGDVFIRYERKIWGDVRWTVQLNARNLVGSNDITPEVINPDGSWAVVRAPVERTFFLTNSFAF
ncbi:MAG: TonB-dependent receptor plug domain-containing protein [Verrucomicrobiota bacterium JB022]|nr:TonB-dependent receptor plug domain-containing protein [Verrucomicrobiota bacterium JB022]